MNHTYTIAWYMWIAYFVVVEGAALLDKRPGDTLSEHVWYWFSMKDQGPSWHIRRVILLTMMAWLSAHFLTGGQF